MRSFLYFIGSRFLSGEKGEKGDKGDQGEPGGIYTKQQMVDMFYPIGSIYMTLASDDPNVTFGGTWVKVPDATYLISTGTYIDGTQVTHTYNAGDTGGNRELTCAGYANGKVDGHTLTANESGVQSHAHTFQAKTSGSWSNVQWGPWYTAGSNRGGINWGLSGATGSVQITSTSKNAVNAHDHKITNVRVAVDTVVEPRYLAVNIWKRTA